jgi:hypothetical protein
VAAAAARGGAGGASGAGRGGAGCASGTAEPEACTRLGEVGDWPRVPRWGCLFYTAAVKKKWTVEIYYETRSDGP